jgi:outer membrane protein OmpA-like peptidoglycan-associated protein
MRFDARTKLLSATMAVMLLINVTGCASMNKTESGAAVGAVGGAAAGAIIGKVAGSTAKGAIIGAVVGGAAGAIIGHKMDQRAKELEQIPGATVERVGEGIQVTFASGLLFDFDSETIKGDAKSNLNLLADNLAKYGDSELMIIGHTDATGTEEYNQDLSERRAQSARRYLASQGVTRTIRTLGRGETEPVATNDDETGRAKNRRVEIAIYAGDALKAQAKREAGES